MLITVFRDCSQPHRVHENGPLLNPISPASPYLMLVLPEQFYLPLILLMEDGPLSDQYTYHCSSYSSWFADGSGPISVPFFHFQLILS